MHGNAVAFEAVIADLKKQSPDAIVCLGDVTMRGPQPQECVDLLRSLDPLITVRGNYDHMFTRWPYGSYDPANPKHQLVHRTYEYTAPRVAPADQEWLANLPTIHTMMIDKVQVELFHASPESLVAINYPSTEEAKLAELRASEATRLVLYGHIHRAFAQQARGLQLVNTGSAGIPFDGDTRASYALVEIEGGDLAVTLRRVAYDIEAALSIARERAMPDIEAFEYGLRNARYPYDIDFTKQEAGHVSQ